MMIICFGFQDPISQIRLSLCRTAVLSRQVKMENRKDVAYVLSNPMLAYASECKILFHENKKCLAN